MGVDELLEATGGRPAIIYEYQTGSVAYFAPDAPDFAEAGELKGEVVAAAQRIRRRARHFWWDFRLTPL